MYQLVSNIPGVEVRLTPNPLNAKIILSEGAKRELALTIAMEEMAEDTIYSAYYALHKEKEPNVEEAKKELKYWHDHWFDEVSDRHSVPSSADRWLEDKRVKMWIGELDTEHCGDCTAVCCSCSRCYVEKLLGICTLSSGKMYNRNISSLYFEEYATPEQKEEVRLRNEKFKADYPPKFQHTPEQIAAYQPAWDEQKRKGEELYAEHKRLYQEQQSRLGM